VKPRSLPQFLEVTRQDGLIFAEFIQADRLIAWHPELSAVELDAPGVQLLEPLFPRRRGDA